MSLTSALGSAHGHQSKISAPSPPPEIESSADQIQLDQDVLHLKLNDYCHPYTDISLNDYQVKWGKSFGMYSDGRYYSNDDVNLIGSYNVRLSSISKLTNEVVIKLVNLEDKKLTEYHLEYPVVVDFSHDDKIYNGFGQHILDGDVDVTTIRISNSSLFKTYRDGAVVDANQSGGGIEFLCSKNYGTFNVFIAKQLNIIATQNFFNAIKLGRAPWKSTIQQPKAVLP